MKKLILGILFTSVLVPLQVGAKPLSYNDLKEEESSNISEVCTLSQFGKEIERFSLQKEVYVCSPKIDLYLEADYPEKYGDTNGKPDDKIFPMGEKVTTRYFFSNGIVAVSSGDYVGYVPIGSLDDEEFWEVSEATCYVTEDTNMFSWPASDAESTGFLLQDELVGQIKSFPNGWSLIDTLGSENEEVFIPTDKLNLGYEIRQTYKDGIKIDEDYHLYVMPQ